VGCGAGRHAAEARRLGAHVVALDRSDLDAKDAAGTLQAITVDWPVARTVSGSAMVGDAITLPFPDGSFDRVIAAEVMEHLPLDVPAMAECFRVLRPGGRLAVTVPRWYPELICWALSDEYHSVEGGHVRIYRRSTLLERLGKVGFEVVDRHHAHALHSPYWWIRCLVGAVGENGIDDESSFWVRNYHRLLVWDIMSRPWLTRTAERLLDPVMGKSLVLYADKPE
jgi:SAM-dependent methyltransferase